MEELSANTSDKALVADPILTSSPFRTTVIVIGAGGTGSHFMHGLAMMHHALIALGHKGLHVLLYDDDAVEEHNVGRQRFGWADVGRNKAEALIERLNRTYGLDWDAAPYRIQFKAGKNSFHEELANIVVTCVDEGLVRNKLHKKFRALCRPPKNTGQDFWEKRIAYWMDLGNDERVGQVVLASKELPTCIELFGRYSEEPARNSCSMEQSLSSQDLFINQQVATIGLAMLWDMFRRGKVTKNVVYTNLASQSTRSQFILLKDAVPKKRSVKKSKKNGNIPDMDRT